MATKRPGLAWLTSQIEQELLPNYYLVLKDYGNVGGRDRDVERDTRVRDLFFNGLASNKSILDFVQSAKAQRSLNQPANSNTDRFLQFGDTRIMRHEGKKNRLLIPQELVKTNEQDMVSDLLAWMESESLPSDAGIHSRLRAISDAMPRENAVGSYPLPIGSEVSGHSKNYISQSCYMDGQFRILVLYLIEKTQEQKKDTNESLAKSHRRSAPSSSTELPDLSRWKLMGVLAKSLEEPKETELRCICSKLGKDERWWPNSQSASETADSVVQPERLEVLFALRLLSEALSMDHVKEPDGGQRFASYLMTDLFVFPVRIAFLLSKLATLHWGNRNNLNLIHSRRCCKCRQVMLATGKTTEQMQRSTRQLKLQPAPSVVKRSDLHLRLIEYYNIEELEYYQPIGFAPQDHANDKKQSLVPLQKYLPSKSSRAGILGKSVHSVHLRAVCLIK